ncbi:NAD-binding protein [Halobacterium jilantaiense]|uniref:TrkA-N domain-containing protein n=1 Tax=Halobacterium jilantaiense TaxID=355548 RepID=A0A1I0MJL8_9EURY|nr:NAD-binding protein [Halobacterium jilantaiense]SEV87751.1 TrkA-N domain-containing protein [Halobacterium jilantaiense]
MTRPRDTTDAPRLPTDGTIFVVEGGAVGHEVATRLSASGKSVTHVTTTPQTDAAPSFDVHVTETLAADSLDAAGLRDASAVVILGSDDARNFLVAQLAHARFGVDRVVARVDDPDRKPLFERQGVDVVCATQAIAHTAVELW